MWTNVGETQRRNKNTNSPIWVRPPQVQTHPSSSHSEAVQPPQTYSPGTGWPCSQWAAGAVWHCVTSHGVHGQQIGLAWAGLSAQALQRCSLHTQWAQEPERATPVVAKPLATARSCSHAAESRAWAGRGWAHLQIHSNPAKSCCEMCPVLQGVKDLLRVSWHLLTYRKAQDRGFDVAAKEHAVIVQQHLKCPALGLHLKWKASTAHRSGVQPCCISEHTGTFLYEEKDDAPSKVRQWVFMALQMSNGLGAAENALVPQERSQLPVLGQIRADFGCRHMEWAHKSRV